MVLVVVAKGADHMTAYTTGKETRYTCNTCGSKVYADLSHLKQKAVYLTMLTSPNHGPNGVLHASYKPASHIFYTSGLRSIYDGLPKYEDLPAAFGGSDKTVNEDYFDALAKVASPTKADTPAKAATHA